MRKRKEEGRSLGVLIHTSGSAVFGSLEKEGRRGRTEVFSVGFWLVVLFGVDILTYGYDRIGMLTISRRSQLRGYMAQWTSCTLHFLPHNLLCLTN